MHTQDLEISTANRVCIDVAIVEDNAQHRERLVKAISEDAQLKLVHIAENGLSILQWLGEHRPDVLIVDLGLPDMPGLAVITYCAQRWPTTAIAVFTMFQDAKNVMESIEAGASGYLLKQSTLRDFPELIRDLYAGGSPMSPSVASYILQRFRSESRVPKSAEIVCDVCLTEREQSILNLVARGFKNNEIAELESISINTVKTYIAKIYAKLSVHSKTEAVFEAGRIGLLRD